MTLGSIAGAHLSTKGAAFCMPPKGEKLRTDGEVTNMTRIASARKERKMSDQSMTFQQSEK